MFRWLLRNWVVIFALILIALGAWLAGGCAAC